MNNFADPWTWVMIVLLSLVMIGLIIFVAHHVKMWANELGNPRQHVITNVPERIECEVLDIIPEAIET